jgi:hypothetical protein
MIKTISLTTFPVSHVRILLGGDHGRLSSIYRSLTTAGFRAKLAHGYEQLESVWQSERQEIVLLEICHDASVAEAMELTTRLKQQDARQFVGYLADMGLSSHDLDGAAVFPRDGDRLPSALRQFFGPQMI